MNLNKYTYKNVRNLIHLPKYSFKFQRFHLNFYRLKVSTQNQPLKPILMQLIPNI